MASQPSALFLSEVMSEQSVMVVKSHSAADISQPLSTDSMRKSTMAALLIIWLQDAAISSLRIKITNVENRFDLI